MFLQVRQGRSGEPWTSSTSLAWCSPAPVVHSQPPLTVLSSAVVGGGVVHVRYLLNRHVHRDYNCLDPVADLVAFARSQGISEAFVGQMTALEEALAQG